MDNQAKMKNWGLEGGEKFYYLKYGENRHGHAILGTATVCVIPVFATVEGTHYVRGVAFCNPTDQFARKVGRAIALGRAVKAIEAQQFTEPIPESKPACILTRMLGWSYFSCWDITLTDNEQRLFKEAEHGETEGAGSR